MLVAHNARFDVGFVDAELRRLRGRRFAGTVLDTVALARKLVPGRTRYSLGALADRFSTNTAPCHRALPDALATAEILLALIGKAQERGAETVDDLVALSVPPARRAHTKRALAEAAPRTPGTYVMRDARDQALYVGAAGDLRQRTMSYFRGAGTPRPVERVLPAVERLEFREAGSPFEARLDEIRLIGDLRPGANRQGARPDRLAYLRLERERVPRLVTAGQVGLDGALYAGPVGQRRAADDVARALRQAYGLRSCRAADPVEEGICLEGRLGRCLAPCRGPAERAAHDAAAAAHGRSAQGGGVPIDRLRARRAALAADLRFEEAARLRDDEAALRRPAPSCGGCGRPGRCTASCCARTATGVSWRRSPSPTASWSSSARCRGPATPRLEMSALATAVERAVRAGPGPGGAARRRRPIAATRRCTWPPRSRGRRARTSPSPASANGLVGAVGAARERV